MDTEVNKVKEILTQEPTVKTPQFHCALSNTPECDCPFQCSTKEELDKHIENNHNKKTHLQCTVCDLYFRDLDALSKHMSMIHKKENLTAKCNICGEPFHGELKEHIKNEHMQSTAQSTDNEQTNCNHCNYAVGTDNELKLHMKQNHYSYKPCDYFQEDRCEDEFCRFNHIKMLQGQHICYKCGDTWRTKRNLMKHIEDAHGDLICHRFQRNECTARKCFFKHVLMTAGNVVGAPRPVTTPVPTPADFPSLHTVRPAVWRQVTGHYPEPPTPLLHNMSQEAHNQMKNLESQVMTALTNMLPQLMNQIMISLRGAQ